MNIIRRWREYCEKRRHKRFLLLYDLPLTGEVLDASCGDGDFLSVLHSYFPQLGFHGIDVSEQYIKQAKLRCPWATLSVADAGLIPYASNSFSVVLSCMSLHHYKDPQGVFQEIARVLRPNGTLYLLDCFPRNRIVQILFNFDGCPEPYHFEKYYLKKEIESFVISAGLSLYETRRMEILSNAKILLLQKPA